MPQQIPYPTPTVTPAPEAAPPPETPVPVPTPRAVVASQALPLPPGRDVIDLAMRLRREARGAAKPLAAIETYDLQVGDRKRYWVNRNLGLVQVSATVERVSEHAIWVFDDQLSINAEELDAAVEAFESVIWPTVTGVFGQVLAAGERGDLRIVILHTRLRSGVSGYYSSADRYPSSVMPYSNESPMLYINSQSSRLGTRGYLTTLSHELQHAAHWAADRDEDTWVNEGLSELAALRAGYRARNVSAFLRSPNTQLNGWAANLGRAAAHYGAAALFMEYLFDHYGGDEAAGVLMRRPEDGLEGIDAALDELGHHVSALDVFQDWLVANYLDAGEGRYSYPGRSLNSGLSLATELVVVPSEIDDTVSQFGARYYVARLGSPNLRISFQGESIARLFPVPPHSGERCWWGNQGDSIDTTLTRTFDLRDADAAVLSWHVWHEIEEDWDYAYVEISADGGETWTILSTELTTSIDKNGTSYGPGYTGATGDWVRDQVDLSNFAGKEVWVRFEYVTDDAVSLSGLCLDDFELPEIGWSDDAEADRGWEAAGFARVANAIPQDYLLQVIRTAPGRAAIVEQVPVSGDGRAETIIRGLEPQDLIIVVVSAIAPVTRTPATYTLTIDRLP